MVSKERLMGRYRPPPEESSKYITPEGEVVLREELDFLWRTKRPEVTRAVAEAAAQGDRSENAEYIYGKKRLREIDSRVRFLRRRLEEIEVVRPGQVGHRRSDPGVDRPTPPAPLPRRPQRPLAGPTRTGHRHPAPLPQGRAPHPRPLQRRRGRRRLARVRRGAAGRDTEDRPPPHGPALSTHQSRPVPPDRSTRHVRQRVFEPHVLLG